MSSFQDVCQMISIVRTLRQANAESAVARRLELQACGELALLTFTKESDQAGLICRGAVPAMVRAVAFGIIRGRPGEGRQPWKLCY